MGGLLLSLGELRPVLAPGVFVARTAVVAGDVTLGPDTNVWFGVVLRGDVAPIRVGAAVNIQDGTIVHVSSGKTGTAIGDRVSIGHAALLHNCVLEPDSFVGMGAIVMDDVVVETGAMVAAGALVPPGKRVPKGEIWGGRPAKLLRPLTDADREVMRTTPQHYVDLARRYLAGA